MRPRHDLIRSLAVAFVSLALTATGCIMQSRDDPAAGTGPSAAGRVLGARLRTSFLPGPGDLTWRVRPLYPLAVGNQWDYDVHTRLTVVANARPPQYPQDTRHPLRDLITGTQLLGAREYFLQQEWNPLMVAPSIGYTSPLRQDGSGLYMLDSAHPLGPGSSAQHAGGDDGSNAATLEAYLDRVIEDSAQRAAFRRAAEQLLARLEATRHSASLFGAPERAGPDLGELSLLRYPLRVGARWVVRQSPRFARVVVARERVVLPAGVFTAWRLHGVSELYGPNDRVRFWYSAAGLLRVSVHYEMNATDDTGTVIGRLIGNEEQVLTAVQLYDPNSPHTLALAPYGADPDE